MMLLLPRGQAFAPTSLLRGLSPWVRLIADLRYGRPLLFSVPLADASMVVGKRVASWRLNLSHRGKPPVTSNRENAVVFFSTEDGRQVLKISLYGQDLGKDIRFLRLLGPAGITPRLLSADPNRNWFVCPYHRFAGRTGRAVSGELFVRHIAGVLYRFWGVKRRTVAHFLRRSGVEPQQLQQYLQGWSIRLPEEHLRKTIPHSVIYGGDVCKETFTDENGQVLILDWERARVGPPAHDMLTVLEYHPELVLQFLRSIGAEEDLQPHWQIAVVAAAWGVPRTAGPRRFRGTGINIHRVLQALTRCLPATNTIDAANAVATNASARNDP